MKKIIWMIWFQGENECPFVVRKCIESWKKLNPEWEVRLLDQYNVLFYLQNMSDFELNFRDVTAASLSDIIRIQLLHEYGGVWADATVFCNKPLDSWLPERMREGFFAFERPERPLASWFLAAEPGNPIIAAWAGAVARYWQDRTQADNYFWFHEVFRDICLEKTDIGASWARVPRVSALPPHQIQDLGMLSPMSDTAHLVDQSLPVFKLTYRYQEDLASNDCLLHWLIGPIESEDRQGREEPVFPKPILASIKVGTENLGDHIQILAGNRLLSRFGLEPSLFIDRDNELADAPDADGPVPILMNGWFKNGNQGWPPHPQFDPIFLGFHIRLFQSPSLMLPESLAYYADHGPIGCRDVYTHELLQEAGIDTFVSNCLSLTFPRRTSTDSQQKVFVVSRDERLADSMPPEIGPFTSVLHYSGDSDFTRNMTKASNLLALYRDEAKLIVTSLLHCALPAIAMGIPVLMFYPVNNPAGRRSDRERFSSLQHIIPIRETEEINSMTITDWSPIPPDVGHIKLAIIDLLVDALGRRGLDRMRAIGPIAPSSILPPGA